MKNKICAICNNKPEANVYFEDGICGKCWDKPFNVTYVTRLDMKEHFSPKEIAKLDDVDMERVASKIADACLETGVYWEGLEQAGEMIFKEK